ncbi:MAG: hypothetical protein ACREFC_07555 [Stellaceae bacterium]
MVAKEQLDSLDRAVIAADEAYQSALDSEHAPMMSRYQPSLLSPRVRALKDAADLASLRRHQAAIDYDRAAR